MLIARYNLCGCLAIIKVLLVPTSDYLGHPFPNRQNQIFERLSDYKDFEVHVVRFNLFNKKRLKSQVIVHELNSNHTNSAAVYYFLNAANHANQIRRIIRQEGIDVVVLSNLAAPLIYTLMDELSGIGVSIVVDLPDYFPTSAAGYLFDIRTVHGRLLSASFNLMLRRIMKHADLVTVSSNALMEYASKAGVQQVAKVADGISDNFLKLHDGRQVRERLGFESSDFVIGYIGSLEFWLDLKTLFKSIAISSSKGLPAKLLLVGKSLHSTYLERVQDQVTKTGISNNVTWLDFVKYEEVPSYISAMDVGTIPFDIHNPTAFYGAPVKRWEYLSQKKPVIATPIPEVVGNSNYISIAKSPEDYSSLFLKFYNHDKSLLGKMEKGHIESLSMTWAKSAEQFSSKLRSVVNHRS
jgi:glycosyltransferase involved in cell wall biosynthesis